jgi:nitrogen regulatory protein PII
MTDIELIYVVVNSGMGSKVMKAAKQCGVSGGTILLGKGTIGNRILEYIGIYDIKKEIVLLISNRATAYTALEKLNEKFKFEKPNHGIGFTTSVCSVHGTRNCKAINEDGERSGGNTMYQAITAIVDKGKAEDVIDAATKAGSKGGTIINGRGSGIHETSKLFAMEIEPEKEIVIILSKNESTEEIVSSIREHLKMEEPGNGIVYVQNVNKTYGLYE